MTARRVSSRGPSGGVIEAKPGNPMRIVVTTFSQTAPPGRRSAQRTLPIASLPQGPLCGLDHKSGQDLA
jgi:hypothetical protein